MSSALLLLTLVSILSPAVLLSAMTLHVIPIRAGRVQRVITESDRRAAPDYDRDGCRSGPGHYSRR